MEGQIQDSNPLAPISIADLNDDATYLVIPTDTLQLQADTVNVIENRVPISSFSPERQQQIMDFYRFSADFQNRRSPQKPAKRTVDTLDLI
jgi:hypothetical protein